MPKTPSGTPSILLGPIALDLGCLDQAALDRAMVRAAKAESDTLGEVLLAQAAFDEAGLDACLDEQQCRLANHPHYGAKPRRDVLFVRVLTKFGL